MLFLNQCTFTGNLGSIKTGTTGGHEWISFSIAVDESWKDQAGEWQKKTIWVPCMGGKSVKEQMKNAATGDRLTLTGTFANPTREGGSNHIKVTGVIVFKKQAQPAVAAQPVGSATQALLNGDPDPDGDIPF